MKLTDLPPDARFVDREGYRWRLLSHGVELTRDDRHVPESVLNDLGIEVAAGKQGATPVASIEGRGTWHRRPDGRVVFAGALAVRETWSGKVRGHSFALFTSGHDLVPVDQFLVDWEWGCRFAIGGAMREEDPAARRCVVAKNPTPWVDRDFGNRRRRGIRGSTDGYEERLQLVEPRAFTVVGMVPQHTPLAAVGDVPARLNRQWIGPAVSRDTSAASAIALVRRLDLDGEPTGEELLVDPLRVILDWHGSILDRVMGRADEDATREPRQRLTDALRGVARNVGLDLADWKRQIVVNVETVTIPHEVLEALVLGDPHGVAETVDYVNIIREELDLARAKRTPPDLVPVAPARDPFPWQE